VGGRHECLQPPQQSVAAKHGRSELRPQQLPRLFAAGLECLELSRLQPFALQDRLTHGGVEILLGQARLFEPELAATESAERLGESSRGIDEERLDLYRGAGATHVRRDRHELQPVDQRSEVAHLRHQVGIDLDRLAALERGGQERARRQASDAIEVAS